MYRFFTQNLRNVGASSIDPRWVNVKDGIRRSTHRFVDYYQSHITSVKADHFLTHILSFYGSDLAVSERSWYADVVNSHMRLSQTLGITSSVHAGRAHQGNFFGPGITELYLSVQKPFDLMDAYLNWRQLRPIEILSHPRSDLNPSLFDGRNLTDANGVAILTIDIPKLMVMYQAFRKWEYCQTMGEADRLRPSAFISTYVLPTLVYSYIEYAIFNRLKNRLLGIEQTKAQYDTVIHLTDWGQRTDGVIDTQLKWLKDRNLRYDTMLQYMPSVEYPDQRYVQQLPQLFTTRQVLGLLTLARLDVLETLVTLGRDSHSRDNDDLNVRFLNHFNRQRVDRTLESTLGRVLARRGVEQIERIRQLLS